MKLFYDLSASFPTVHSKQQMHCFVAHIDIFVLKVQIKQLATLTVLPIREAHQLCSQKLCKQFRLGGLATPVKTFKNDEQPALFLHLSINSLLR